MLKMGQIGRQSWLRFVCVTSHNLLGFVKMDYNTRLLSKFVTVQLFYSQAVAQVVITRRVIYIVLSDYK